jgi:hypothetical protein
MLLRVSTRHLGHAGSVIRRTRRRDHNIDDMTGLKLANVIRKRRPGVPVVLLALEPVTSNEITLCITKYALFPALIDGIYSCPHWPAGLLCPVGTHDITGRSGC